MDAKRFHSTPGVDRDLFDISRSIPAIAPDRIRKERLARAGADPLAIRDLLDVTETVPPPLAVTVGLPLEAMSAARNVMFEPGKSRSGRLGFSARDAGTHGAAPGPGQRRPHVERFLASPDLRFEALTIDSGGMDRSIKWACALVLLFGGSMVAVWALA